MERYWGIFFALNHGGGGGGASSKNRVEVIGGGSHRVNQETGLESGTVEPASRNAEEPAEEPKPWEVDPMEGHDTLGGP